VEEVEHGIIAYTKLLFCINRAQLSRDALFDIVSVSGSWEGFFLGVALYPNFYMCSYKLSLYLFWQTRERLQMS
jgi:hypothetical protein